MNKYKFIFFYIDKTKLIFKDRTKLLTWYKAYEKFCEEVVDDEIISL